MIVVWQPDRSTFSGRRGNDKIWRDRDPASKNQHSREWALGRQDSAAHPPAAAGRTGHRRGRHAEFAREVGSAKRA